MEEKELSDEMKRELTFAQLVIRMTALENVLLNLNIVEKDVLVSEIKRISDLISDEIRKNKVESK
jgi:hypothetical protein